MVLALLISTKGLILCSILSKTYNVGQLAQYNLLSGHYRIQWKANSCIV